MIYFLIYCMIGVASILVVGSLARRKFRNSSYSRITSRRSASDEAILYSTLYVNNPSSTTVDTSSATAHHHSIDCSSSSSSHDAGSFDCGGSGGHH